MLPGYKGARFAALPLLVFALCVEAASVGEGVDAFKAGRYADALGILTPFAQQGDAESQRVIGEMIYNGQGVQKDLSGAFRWTLLAAEGGSRIAQYSLGYLYERGEGAERSATDAERWYTKAASQGYIPAQLKLAELYRTRNASIALYWLEQARLLGHPMDNNYRTLMEQVNAARLSMAAAEWQQEAEQQRQMDEAQRAQAAAFEQQMREEDAAAGQATDQILARMQQQVAENARILNRFGPPSAVAMAETRPDRPRPAAGNGVSPPDEPRTARGGSALAQADPSAGQENWNVPREASPPRKHVFEREWDFPGTGTSQEEACGKAREKQARREYGIYGVVALVRVGGCDCKHIVRPGFGPNVPRMDYYDCRIPFTARIETETNPDQGPSGPGSNRSR